MNCKRNLAMLDMCMETERNVAAGLLAELTTWGDLIGGHIIVECTITGNKAEYEYDIDNTLMNFILDVNSDTPSLGFKPSEIKQGTTTENSGVNIDGPDTGFSTNQVRH